MQITNEKLQVEMRSEWHDAHQCYFGLLHQSITNRTANSEGFGFMLF